MIVIGFDYGIKKIGVAIGQNITKKARPLKFLHAKNGNPNWDNIQHLIQYWEPKIIIVGLPLNINGTRQKITKQAEKFGNLLMCRCNILVRMHDERLTTVEAKSIMFKKGGFKALKKEKIHSCAAQIILESWFDQNLFKV